MDEVDRPDEAAIVSRRTERFGALPARVHPEDIVGLVETRQTEGRPAAAPTEAQYTAIYHV